VMDAVEVARRAEEFPRWRYPFAFPGAPRPRRDREIRHLERKRYFFDPLVELVHGLDGKRVLDLGCNSGFWSLCAAEAGCDFVLGIDGSSEHIPQANFVFEASGYPPDRYRFLAANIFDVDFSGWGAFDVVLCLGLFYHVSKQMDLMEKIASVSKDLVVIDTALCRAPGSYLQIRRDVVGRPLDSADYDLVMKPTRRAVLDLAQAFGYSVAVLKPGFRDYTGSEDYKYGGRRAFICAKKTELSALGNVENGGLGKYWADLSWYTHRGVNRVRPAALRLQRTRTR
jgi:SAM-dependent methyltransferase